MLGKFKILFFIVWSAPFMPLNYSSLNLFDFDPRVNSLNRKIITIRLLILCYSSKVFEHQWRNYFLSLCVHLITKLFHVCRKWLPHIETSRCYREDTTSHWKPVLLDAPGKYLHLFALAIFFFICLRKYELINYACT